MWEATDWRGPWNGHQPLHQGAPQANGGAGEACFSSQQPRDGKPDFHCFKEFRVVFRHARILAVQRWTFLDQQGLRAQIMLSFSLSLGSFPCIDSIHEGLSPCGTTLLVMASDLYPVSSAKMSVCPSVGFSVTFLGLTLNWLWLVAPPVAEGTRRSEHQAWWQLPAKPRD